MKILYAIQGTGNGHVICARDIIPLLQKRGSVDILISGTQSDIDLPYPIKYRLHGLGFVFGKNGGIDYKETYRQTNIKRFLYEIKSLPVWDYDVVISDFEPVSAWACRIKGKASVGLSHQIAVTNNQSPQPPKMDLLGKSVLNFYAPASLKFGYHFLPYNTHIFSPVIRKEIRSVSKKNDGHYSVYLPAYSAELIIKILTFFPSIHWHIFSKDCMEEYNVGNIRIRPIQNEAFIKSMAASEGVLCGAGFQTPAEVLFLNKKLMVVPMRGQYEQQCNAAALEKLGVPILKNLKFRQVEKIKKWIENETVLSISFPDETQELVNTVLAAATSISSFNDSEKDKCYTLKKRISRKIFQLKLNN